VIALVTACAENESSNNAGGGNTGFTTDVYQNQVPVAADPKGGLRWDRAEYMAKPGNVTFVVTNNSPITHNFVIEGNGVKATSKNFRTQAPQFLSLANMTAGQYQIICTVPGHREGGMVARLTVA
jgi:uncharacterized cupredoxin-like copper-binding protein